MIYIKDFGTQRGQPVEFVNLLLCFVAPKAVLVGTCLFEQVLFCFEVVLVAPLFRSGVLNNPSNNFETWIIYCFVLLSKLILLRLTQSGLSECRLRSVSFENLYFYLNKFIALQQRQLNVQFVIQCVSLKQMLCLLTHRGFCINVEVNQVEIIVQSVNLYLMVCTIQLTQELEEPVNSVLEKIKLDSDCCKKKSTKLSHLE